MSPISDSKANMQLHVSAVQPFRHIRSIALVNAVQPRAIPRGITSRAPTKPAKHPRELAVLLFSDWLWSESSTVLVAGALRCWSSGLDGGGPVGSMLEEIAMMSTVYVCSVPILYGFFASKYQAAWQGVNKASCAVTALQRVLASCTHNNQGRMVRRRCQ